ncbi:MAG: hypothetical protein V3V28_12865 [Polaribacter sp.]|uniref:hypothetical protein n=1 Tax=Polaribacter sp. TaxID=1920175 RepID=UPI002F35A704
MKSNLFTFFFHLFIILILTIVTQTGGIVYLISLFVISKKKTSHKIKRFVFFTILYFFTTFLIVPNTAPFFGRIKIKDNHRVKGHSFITKLCNRNYVRPKLHSVLTDVSLRVNKEFPEIKIIYLDASFPFFDGFPLLPHLSHNDGKKIDISFIYEDEKGKVTNLKPANSGYGVFSNPKKGEINLPKNCKEKGYWQYDFTKYFTFGNLNKDLKLSGKATKILIQKIINNNNVSKLFIEPHLKNRLNLNHNKIRFHGCRAVRHDDHIHFQIK